MAITATGAIYKSLIFDGEDSRDYGVYITGAGVYNAPERAVEMISIPGRNGSFALDGGRFENIEIEYPAGIFADNETEFAAAVSDFRNVLCSKRGYCRLTDEYNPGEYRMAVYKSGLEVDPAQLRAGEFKIKFIAKPQRWLTSGETPVAVSSGDTVSNPTLFETGPLIAAHGYGEINIGGATLKIINDAIGNVDIVKGTKGVNGEGATSVLLTVDYSSFSGVINSGDPISGLIASGAQVMRVLGSGITITSKDGATGSWIMASVGLGWTPLSLSAFPANNQTQTITTTTAIGLSNGVTFNAIETVNITNKPNGIIEITSTLTTSTDVSAYIEHNISNCMVNNVSANSSVPVTQTAIYIDLDIGEAYKIENDEFVPLNSSVIIPAELPQLAPGNNVITFDNTITDVEITTRVWKI